MAMKTAPTEIKLHTYQVGFGDCFLLKFRYADPTKEPDRHVLIDFGSSGVPHGRKDDVMVRVARDIKDKCGKGRLDIVVASHRHSDHLSGFTPSKNKGEGPGDIIRQCRPNLVLQPWTEDPKAKPDARSATDELPMKQKYLLALDRGSSFTEALVGELPLLRRGLGKELAAQLSFLGETGLPNLPAVTNLRSMGRNLYLNALCDLDTDSVLPGIKLHVLGPPTLNQSDRIAKQRRNDEAEFWLRQVLSDCGRAGDGRPAFRGPRLKSRPGYANWLIPRLQASRGAGLFELVRALDKQMNNTSLILLFEVGHQRLLFPGDAQIENWSYILDQASNRPGLRKLLTGVTFYKVGHHGSRNATPKSLWNMFANRGPRGTKHRLVTVVSTMEHKHGDPQKNTEVPRRTLVEALKAQSEYHSTQGIERGLCMTISLDPRQPSH